MGSTAFRKSVERIRRLAEATDAELLDRYAAGDGSAFSELAERHAGLIRSVCRRLLDNPQDAEDAAQATLIVLARKAAHIRHRRSIAGWLYGVAHRVAGNLRRGERRRRLRERHAAARTVDPPPSEASLREVQEILLDEVRQLPEKLRSPFVLCHLDGHGRAEAARLLGWKDGTLSGRLAEAKRRLADRLRRRGVELPAALTALAVLAPATAEQPGPTAAAARLAAEALRTVPAKWAIIGLAAVASVAWLAVGVADDPIPTPQSETEPEAEPVARVDRFGDPLPPGAVARLGTVRFRHGQRVNGLAFRPDGKSLVSAGDGSLRVWDVESGRCIQELPRGGEIVDRLAVSQDNMVVLTHNDSIVYRADFERGALDELFRVRRGYDVRVAVSPDGSVAAVGAEVPGVNVRQSDGGNLVQSFGTGERGVWTLAWAPDGRCLAAHCRDGTVRVWDVVTGRERFRKELPTQQRGVSVGYAVALSPDGRTIAAGSTGRSFRLWDMETGEGRLAVGDHEGVGLEIPSIAFSPDGNRVACACPSYYLQVWDVRTGQRLLRLPFSADDVVFSPDGKTLATADGPSIRLWDSHTGEEIEPVGRGHQSVLRGLGVSPDGTRVVTGGTDTHDPGRLWDLATGRELAHGHWQGRVVISPDGRSAVSGKSVWDLATGKLSCELPGIDRPTTAFAFSRNGKVLAVGYRPIAGEPGSIAVYDFPAGRLLRRVGSGEVTEIDLTPDGKTLAAGSRDGSFQFWDVATGRRIRLASDFSILKTKTEGLAVSAKGKTLTVAGSLGEVGVFDVETGKRLVTIDRTTPGAVHENSSCMALSPDGRCIAIGYSPRRSPRNPHGNSITLWNASTGEPRLHLAGHQGVVSQLAFAGDSRKLVSVSFDSTGLVWDLVEAAAGWRTEDDPSPGELWEELLSPDEMAAYRATCELARHSEGPAFLRDRLKPIEADEDEIQRLIRDLSDRRFAVREKAEAELLRFGTAAAPALREVRTSPSAEVQARAERLLGRLSSELRREDRAREALKLAGQNP